MFLSESEGFDMHRVGRNLIIIFSVMLLALFVLLWIPAATVIIFGRTPSFDDFIISSGFIVFVYTTLICIVSSIFYRGDPYGDPDIFVGLLFYCFIPTMPIVALAIAIGVTVATEITLGFAAFFVALIANIVGVIPGAFYSFCFDCIASAIRSKRRRKREANRPWSPYYSPSRPPDWNYTDESSDDRERFADA